jgi:hypothetical protein
MNNTSLDNIQLKDLKLSLLMWGVSEFVGFALFPALQLIQPKGEVLRSWILMSLPVGLGGILLMVASSKLVMLINQRTSGQLKTFVAIAAGLASWLAFAGILYPVLMAGMEFFTKPYNPA